MVVADYEVDAETAGIVDLVYGLDAAVKYYHKAYALRGCVVDATLRNPVAFVVACRDVVFNVGIEVAQIAVDERHGGGAVHVVVAVDHYPLFRPHGLVEPGHGFVHVRHKERIVKILERWMEEMFRFLDRRDAALHKQTAYRRTSCVALRES